MKCDIIIPVYNRPDLTTRCLKSICEHTRVPFNLILIDNNSDPETRDYLRSFTSVHENVLLVRNEENVGWVKALNHGIRLSTSPFVCVMNNDTVVRTGGWLSKMIDIAVMEDDIGLVNPHFQAKRCVLPDWPFIEVDFCRGYCMLIKRYVIDKIGFFDESYGLGYYDDDDYSVRAIRVGFRCVRASGVFVEHIGDSTFSDMFKKTKRLELHEKNKKLFYSKWGRRLKLVFIFTEEKDRSAVSDILFFLARRQHVIYLWNSMRPLNLRHINIREKIFPAFLRPFIFLLALYMNKIKKPEKRYNAVFVDNAGLHASLAGVIPAAYFFDIEKDGSRIKELVDALSRAE